MWIWGAVATILIIMTFTASFAWDNLSGTVKRMPSDSSNLAEQTITYTDDEEFLGLHLRTEHTVDEFMESLRQRHKPKNTEAVEEDAIEETVTDSEDCEQPS